MCPMNETPERIYHWMDSQLSIARLYGRCKFNGAAYSIACDEPGQPLVRDDVLLRERMASKQKQREFAKSERERWMRLQESLLPPNP